MRILLTGASLGIGHYLTNALIDQGHTIWGIARSREPLEKLHEKHSDSFLYSNCDISSYDQLQKVHTFLKKEWNSIDAIICCAGIQGPIGNAMDNDVKKWSSTIRTNLDGTFYTIHSFFDLLSPNTQAKIICFSGGGATSHRVKLSAYAAAKTGIARLVETLAQEWLGKTIDINAIAPGAINTRLTDEIIALGPEIAGKEYDTAFKQKETGGGSLEKVLKLVNYLLSQESNGISGRLISAVWDTQDEMTINKEIIQNSDIYTLRRIIPKDRGMDWE